MTLNKLIAPAMQQPDGQRSGRLELASLRIAVEAQAFVT
jgi:hypothetical protein